MGENNFSFHPDKSTSAPIDVVGMTKKAPSAPNGNTTQPKKNQNVLLAVLACVICAVLCGVTVFSSILFAGMAGQRKAEAIMAAFQPKTEVTVVNQNSTVVENNGPVYTEEQRVIAVARSEQSVLSIHAFLTQEHQQSGVYFSAGSGVVWSGSSATQSATFSYIVTNYHVVENGKFFTVTTYDNHSYSATFVGGDVFSDLAVLKVDHPLPQAEKSSNAEIKKGMSILAIGNTLNAYSGTVTDGIISALTRETEIDGITQTLLQFDAPSNKGNSGGGLFDYHGRLCGIINSKNMGVGIEGLAFAIPIDTVKSIVGQILEYGFVPGRPQMGISTFYYDGTVSLTEIEAAFPGLTTYINATNNKHGIYVVDPQATSLRKGDYLYKLDGKTISDSADLRAFLSKKQAGQTIQVTVGRALSLGNGMFGTPTYQIQEITFPLTLTQRVS
jgi:serine protease Do